MELKVAPPSHAPFVIGLDPSSAREVVFHHESLVEDGDRRVAWAD